MSIDDINDEIRAFRDSRDWMQFHNPKDMAVAISIEANELLEHFLWKGPADSEQYAREHKQEISDEIADVAIYLFELADNLGIDLLTAMKEKIRKNDLKYPVSKSRGKSTKYNEL